MRLVCLCPTYGRAPQPLETAIACFLAQDYADARLLILDDSGLLPAQAGERWQVVSVPDRYRSLPHKYEALAGLAGDDWEAAIVWEDDDVYLPWHLSTYAAALEQGLWAHPPEVYAHSARGLQRIYATGNRHGALGIRREGVELIDRWRAAIPVDQPLIATWDQLTIAMLTDHAKPIDPTGPRGPSYVYRWGTSGAVNMTALTEKVDGEILTYVRVPAPSRPVRTRLDPQLDPIASGIVGELSGDDGAATAQLTIVIAAHDDSDRVYSTVQSLRLQGELGPGVELLIGDDFTNARGEVVLSCEAGTRFEPGAIRALLEFFDANKGCVDLIQGPRLDDARDVVWTHLDPGWSHQDWGLPSSDPRGTVPTAAPYEIVMQDLRVFACRRDAWPGVNRAFRNSLGGAGYLHEKFRRAGGRCLLLPAMRWVAPSPNATAPANRLHDYLVARSELDLDVSDVLAHFSESLGEDRVVEVARAALGGG